MKKILLIFCVLIFTCGSAWGSLGEFGDGTSPSDTVYMSFATWDSSGHGANADSVCWIRFFHGGKIDSVLSTDATYLLGGRPGIYVLPKRAFDGTNYGQYTVSFWFNYTDKDQRVYQSNSYTVRDGDIENAPQNIEDIKTATDATLDDSLGNTKNKALSYLDAAISSRYANNDSLGNALNRIAVILDDSSGNAKNKAILCYDIVSVLLDDSLGNAKNNILAYLDEAISGLDDDPWDNDTGEVALTKYGGAILDYDNYKGTGADLSDEVDSILAAIYDRANDTSFVRVIRQYILKHLYPDSITIDNSNAWDLSGGGDVSSEVDSILVALYDRANDSSFVRLISDWLLAVKGKTDSSSFSAAGLIKSTPQTNVDIATASQLSIAAQCSTHNKAMMKRTWDQDDNAQLSIENPPGDVGITQAGADKVWGSTTRSLTDKSGFSLSTNYMTKGDSSLYMRGDLANLKNLDTYLPLTQTRVHFVDSVGEEIGGTGLTKEEIAHECYDTLYVHKEDFQGEAAGLTREEIAHETYCTLYVHQEDFKAGAGVGEYACTVSVRDTSLQAGIAGATVNVRNSDQTATLRWGMTNGNGKVIFNLDSLGTGESYMLWLSELSYNFVMPETMDVRDNATFTFYGTAFDWGDPPAENQCAVYDQIFDLELDSLSGVVITVSLHVPADSILRYDDFPISPYRKSYTTDVTGRWRFDLIPNADLQPDGTFYIFSFKYPADETGKYFIYIDTTTVPKQESARYKDISGKM